MRTNDFLQKFGMSESDLHDFLSSERAELAARAFLSGRTEAKANGVSGGVNKVVQVVDFSAYPMRDESGPYVSYRCPLCSTRARVRVLKRVRATSSKDAEQKQQPIPGVEG